MKIYGYCYDDLTRYLNALLQSGYAFTSLVNTLQQTYHFKEIAHPVPGGLDLNIADEEEFSPDKLRANMERLYMTVLIGLMGFGKHIARLRSWREKRRSAFFCAVSQPHN